MNPDTWKLIAALGGVLITCVTGPMIWALRTEGKLIRTETKTLGIELRAEMAAMEARLEAKITSVETRLTADLTATEARLNERIDTRLVHR